MRVLLLHPEDKFPPLKADPFDLIVDFARAPASTYQHWASHAGCRVISLFDFAEEIEDVHRIRDLFRLGSGHIVDRRGIDWWEVLCPLLLPAFEQALLLRRLAGELKPGCHLYSSRPDARASALQSLLGAELSCGSGEGSTRLRHYWTAFSRLNAAQVAQVCQDKFDAQHRLRRRLAPRRLGSKRPRVLLPSAYTNVSRSAAAYARLLPDQEFLMVLARRAARWQPLPANVSLASLDSYYPAQEPAEVNALLEAWNNLEKHLVSSAAEFKLAVEAGLLSRMGGLISWGVAAREAWENVFAAENVSACLSADDANPYSSLPLILARSRGLPALACHHGAMDYRMGIKPLQADFYLAKGELERDYLLRQCQVAPGRIVIGGPQSARRHSFVLPPEGERKSLVFFTEPYGSDGCRIEEVYRDLLPKLWLLAETCGLKLVFKLHPFESVEGHRRLLRKFLSREQLRHIEILAGPLLPELWQSARFAITAQSTVAMESAVLGIPVFLCGWLRSLLGGYVQQYARFGIGRVLNSSAEIAEIPQILKDENLPGEQDGRKIRQALDPAEFSELLNGVHSVPAANAS